MTVFLQKACCNIMFQLSIDIQLALKLKYFIHCAFYKNIIRICVNQKLKGRYEENI